MAARRRRRRGGGGAGGVLPPARACRDVAVEAGCAKSVADSAARLGKGESPLEVVVRRQDMEEEKEGGAIFIF